MQQFYNYTADFKNYTNFYYATAHTKHYSLQNILNQKIRQLDSITLQIDNTQGLTSIK